ncbi:MAG: GntR family transcriptional regulator [bacterium]|nr:GntR family transcriptional regulator [bacterium]
MIEIDPRDARPIWRQIEQGLRDLIRRGRLEPGVAVPSVRELARSQRVNPATVSKAYRSLTDAGYLEVRRGEGTFVAVTAPRLDSRRRREILRSEAARLIEFAMGLDVSADELSSVLDEIWSEHLEGATSLRERKHARIRL